MVSFIACGDEPGTSVPDASVADDAAVSVDITVSADAAGPADTAGPGDTPGPADTSSPGEATSRYTVGPEERELLVRRPGSVFDGAVVTISAGAFALSRTVWLEELPPDPEVGAFAPILLIRTEEDLPLDGVTVQLPASTAPAGVDPSDLALMGYARGTARWVRLDAASKADDPGALAGSLAGLSAAADANVSGKLYVVGETVDTVAAAVALGAHGVVWSMMPYSDEIKEGAAAAVMSAHQHILPLRLTAHSAPRGERGGAARTLNLVESRLGSGTSSSAETTEQLCAVATGPQRTLWAARRQHQTSPVPPLTRPGRA